MTTTTRVLLALLALSLAANALGTWRNRRLTGDLVRLGSRADSLATVAAVSRADLEATNAASLALVADTARLNRSLRDARRMAAALVANARAASTVAADPTVGDSALRLVIVGLVADAERAAAAWARADSAATKRIVELERQLLASATASERALDDLGRAYEAKMAREVALWRSRVPTPIQRLTRAAIWFGGGYVLASLAP